MTQHTPGPWIIDGHGQIITQERTGPVSHEIIAHMPAWFAAAKAGAHATQDHILSNARLLVSAPDLLAALQEFVQLSNNLAVALTAEQVSESIQYITIHCHVARAAIDKATKPSTL